MNSSQTHRFLFALTLILAFILVFSGCQTTDEDTEDADGDATSEDGDVEDGADGDGSEEDPIADGDSSGELNLDYAADCPDLATCVIAACSDSDLESQFSLDKCTLESCEEDYIACFGEFGESTCSQMMICINDCVAENTIEECSVTCTGSASAEAQLQYMDIGLCAEELCEEGALQDPLNNLPCFLTTCVDVGEVCCGELLTNCMPI